MPMLWEMPHSRDATTKARVAHWNRRTSPKRRLREPVSGSAIALLTANEVITQVAWLALAPRLPEMVGSETLAIVVSSTCMNEASARPRVARATLGGRNGRAAAPALGAAPGPGAAAVAEDMGEGCPSAVRARPDLFDDLRDQRVGLVQLLAVDGGGEARSGGLARLRQHLAAVVADVDVDVHAQAQAQRMLGQLLRVQLDPHRHALHDLDPVARGVLRRQQRERAAGTQAERGDLALVADAAAVQVGLDLDRLADAHARQLGLLEVGLHPHLLQRHHGHQGGARLHALAQLHLAPGHV